MSCGASRGHGGDFQTAAKRPHLGSSAGASHAPNKQMAATRCVHLRFKQRTNDGPSAVEKLERVS